MVKKTKRMLGAESSAPPPEGALRWSVERRLAFIEERLFWLGEVNRMDLVRRFGVSMSQASGDIARYLALTPPGVVYDKSAKRYTAGQAFAPVIAAPNPARFLSELRLVEAGILPVEDTVLGAPLPSDSTPLPERAVDPFVLRAVLRGIRGREAVDISYQSMSRPFPARRVIEAHALAHDGFRWHTRAFDRETGEFRDFVLGRITKPRRLDPARSRPGDDLAWNDWMEMRIAPHPDLTPAQTKAVRLDYAIHGPFATVRVRRALLFYALKRLGLDVAPDARPPHEQHIVLVNRTEIEAMLVAHGQT